MCYFLDCKIFFQVALKNAILSVLNKKLQKIR